MPTVTTTLVGPDTGIAAMAGLTDASGAATNADTASCIYCYSLR